ncbi:hypothetical protein BATDEDRAFT_85738 [Batrachochytrium dendrobatidis JAM81]|uniref:Mitochondrial distribution and morphology protein 12 n=2 Tax=Batrachochytrium dendrobatidis TaxID=109871 RepID=F4NT33_BATDJ|nr:uncharacterized protein BATDEDRAFT_85738 [Batrachochytrium dendrobatidis JAM81]XP_006679981.1 uncharacterized protein BATDEDRAFT_35379 [Batrachochytrium dendrobatidis JAM81]KAJ8331447.1 Mitochondrial distribution and morphology protein 12 [Batrachochytrium dendrobatidis]OAJ36109.1 hypothetical protein BDEG_20319 [Batrachochytrium dendrobatidis JEL423]EGF79219.1 hypothetical protein BATDEDRAFT_35379 [Batrachochytrium dendrobatidis JAM81]EGF83077.1 hypothetical protein BATDEDRAFT_85738 [Batra|eukprot:XP_006675973.1 hypothetical protein BATDEDRAFT_85738 [Batrachochytrium dendrobatidis JAM81]
MSFIIDWNLLNDGVEAERLKLLVNDHFQEVARPSFLGKVTVMQLDFGDIPPEVTIEDICDPLADFYIQEDPAFEYEHDHIQSHSYNSRQNIDTTAASEQISVSDGIGHHGSAIYKEPSLSFDSTNNLRYVQLPPQDTDAQLELNVRYHGNMRLSISTELIVNQPTPAFMVLPLALTLTGFSFDGTAVIAYLGYAINFCFKEPLDGNSILQDMTIESEIGDRNKQVLKNVEKIERFIVQQLKSFFNDFLVFPNFHSIYLTQDDTYTECSSQHSGFNQADTGI